MRAPSPPSTATASAASPSDVVINLRKLKGPNSPASTLSNESTTECLLKWISNVSIKKRKFRRVSRCRNLLAEAVLNNALKKAQSELGRKQEEKRQNLARFNQLLAQQQKQFSSNKSYYNRYSIPELMDQNQSHDYDDKSQDVNNANSQNQNDDSITFYAAAGSGSDDNNNNNYYYQAQKKTKISADNYSNYENDEEIRISLSGLDSFFNKLKGI